MNLITEELAKFLLQGKNNRAMLVSIITITYNSENYLEETIKSVISQDYSNIEYIIIDGGSIDGTPNIIKKYRSKISKWISEPDEGISDAMNKGIRMASGEIIGIIHSDDFYADSTVIKRVVEIFTMNAEIKAVYGIQDFVDPVTNKLILTWGRDSHPSEIKKRMYIPHPTLFVRREVYDTIGLFRKDFKVAMDYEWAIRLIKYTKPYFLNYKIACMRDSGTSGKQFQQSFRESAKALFENKYYFHAIMTMFRNVIKRALIVLGLKRFLYKLWGKNVSPQNVK